MKNKLSLLRSLALSVLLITLLISPETKTTEPIFNRGDVNTDSMRDISDPIFTLNYLFLGRLEPQCRDAADVNDDGVIDISDATMLLWFLFQGSIQPVGPNGFCGIDITEDELDCQNYPPCPFIDSSELLTRIFALTGDDTTPIFINDFAISFNEEVIDLDEFLAP